MENATNVREKNFISIKDLKIILGEDNEEITDCMVRKFFNSIRKIAMEDLATKGLIIPKKSVVPSAYVWRYLKPYGITK